MAEIALPDRMSCTAVDSVPERSTILRGLRGRDIFHQRTRRIRPVLVDNGDTEMPDDGMTEDGGENHERKQRHAEDQQQRHTIVKQPVRTPRRATRRNPGFAASLIAVTASRDTRSSRVAVRRTGCDRVGAD